MLKNFDKNQNYYKFYKRKNIPIVFIHGVGLDHEMWSPQVKSFKNNSILVYDLLGHGKTPLIKKNVNFEDFSNQLNNLLNNLILLIQASCSMPGKFDHTCKFWRFNSDFNSLILLTTYSGVPKSKFLLCKKS